MSEASKTGFLEGAHYSMFPPPPKNRSIRFARPPFAASQLSEKTGRGEDGVLLIKEGRWGGFGGVINIFALPGLFLLRPERPFA